MGPNFAEIFGLTFFYLTPCYDIQPRRPVMFESARSFPTIFFPLREQLIWRKIIFKPFQPVNHQGPRWVRIKKKMLKNPCDTAPLTLSFTKKYIFVWWGMAVLNHPSSFLYGKFKTHWETKCVQLACVSSVANSLLKGHCHEKSFQTETVGVQAIGPTDVQHPLLTS